MGNKPLIIQIEIDADALPTSEHVRQALEESLTQRLRGVCVTYLRGYGTHTDYSGRWDRVRSQIVTRRRRFGTGHKIG